MEYTHVVIAVDRIMRSPYDAPMLVKISPYRSKIALDNDVLELKLALRKQLHIYGDLYKLSIHRIDRRIYVTKRSPDGD